MRLFELLDKFDIYEDEEVKRTAKEAGIENLSFQKGYLMKNILKTLRWSEKEEDSSVWAEVRDIQSLFNKRLFKEIQKRIDDAREHAREAEEFTAELELIDLRIRYWKEEQKFDNYLHHSETFLNEKLAVLKKIERMLDYERLYEKAFAKYLVHRQCRTEEDRLEVRTLLTDELLVKDDLANSKTGKLLRNSTLLKSNIMLGDFAQSLKYSDEKLEIFHSSNRLRNKLRIQYLRALMENGAIAMMLDNRPKATAAFSRFTAIVDKNDVSIIEPWNRFLVLSLVQRIEIGEIEDCDEICKMIFEELARNREYVNPEIRLLHHFFVGYYYFLKEDYSGSLKAITEFFDEAKFGVRKDLVAVAKIFNLLIHLEIGNQDLIEYQLRNTRAFLKRHQIEFLFEKIVLDLIGGSLKSVNAADLKKRFTDAKQRLDALWEDKFDSTLNHYFDFKSWIISKSKNRKLVEIIRESTQG